jgi:hypothetical protein
LIVSEIAVYRPEQLRLVKLNAFLRPLTGRRISNPAAGPAKSKNGHQTQSQQADRSWLRDGCDNWVDRDHTVAGVFTSTRVDDPLDCREVDRLRRMRKAQNILTFVLRLFTAEPVFGSRSRFVI